MLDKIVGQVFGYQNPLSLEQFSKKFTFDIRLPQQVIDDSDGSITWSQTVNPTRFIKQQNAHTIENTAKAGQPAPITMFRPARPLSGIQDVLAAWGEINLTTAEKMINSINVSESDNIDGCENVFHSQDIRDSKNILLSDGIGNSEFMAACQRSRNSSFCIRLDDCGECTNCFNVSWAGKLTNCLFMHDCGDMQDSMFCTNVSGGRFCIANMEYPEAEYRRLRDEVVRWILSPAS